MGEALRKAFMGRAAYLDWKAGQAEKHEYLRGEIFAMVGARREHAIVTLTLGSLLRAHLRRGPCQPFVANMKPHVEAADAYFHPDVMVTCDERDHRAVHAIEHPCLVVEVLSEATAACDRGEKFAAYRKLPSLVEYLLVDIEVRQLDLYRRGDAHWLPLEDVDGSGLRLDSVGLTLHPDQAFEDLRGPVG